MNNYWLIRKGRRTAIRQINLLFHKFIGRKPTSIDAVFESMRNIVLKFFKRNPEFIKFFSNGIDPFKYDLDIKKDDDGLITDAVFIPLDNQWTP